MQIVVYVSQLMDDTGLRLRPRWDRIHGGALISGDELRGASVRVNPVYEKSVQVSIVHFAAPDCDTA